MKTYLDFLPCLMNQALKAARAATDDGKVHRQALDGEDSNIFFLLRAKCQVLAELLGVQVGDAVLKQQPP